MGTRKKGKQNYFQAFYQHARPIPVMIDDASSSKKIDKRLRPITHIFQTLMRDTFANTSTANRITRC